MKTRLLVSTLLAIAVAIPVGACRLVVGIETDPTFDGPPGPAATSAPPQECGAFHYSNPKCGECGIANCCEESTQCSGESECAALLACEQACSTYDYQCLRLCELARPNAVDRARAFGACLDEMCPATCIRRQWACLENPSTAVPGTGPPITYSVRYTDVESGAPLAGLRVRACNAYDLSCSTPIIPPVVTDADGLAVLRLSTNFFDGYIELTDESGTYEPWLFSFWPPLSQDIVDGYGMAKPAADAKLKASIGTQRPDLAQLIALVLDCIDNIPAGVQVSFEPANGSTPYYTINQGGVPSNAATQTIEYGYFGALNVVPGTVTVRASVVENSLSFPPVTVLTRAGATSIVSFWATRPR